MSRLKSALASFSKSIWFFPAVLFIVVIFLSSLQLNGSSMGMYHNIFYGSTSKDPNLIANQPRAIRSDEWLVTTQLSLAQTQDKFNDVNPNIGDGEDMSVMTDTPNTSFLQLFKPQNFGYFFLPTGTAFSLKWWLPVYLLVMSVYFFMLTLVPRKKLLAILASLCFTASPFIVWWGQYSTLYTALFMTIVVIKMLHSASIRKSLLWGMLLSYLTTSFIVILYPPFQIPCALVLLSFLIGYYLDHRPKTWHGHKPLVFGTILAVTLTIILTSLCFVPKLSVIETAADTAYPGARVVKSGGFNLEFFMASNVSILTQNDSRATSYGWLKNQSEGSNFLLGFVLLLPLLVYIAIKYRHKINNLHTIYGVLIISLIFLVWMFIPDVDWIGRVTLLNRVPQARLLIGFGLINLLVFILFTQIYTAKEDFKLPKQATIFYTLIILVIYLFLDIHIHQLFPTFIGLKWAILLALPYPIILYLLLTRRPVAAMSLLLVFSTVSVGTIHPLYRGVDTLTNSQVSQAIRLVDPGNSKKWVTDSLLLENMPSMNGKKSLSGTYIYPQNKLWENDFPKKDHDMYDRYAHVHFVFDRNATVTITRSLTQPGQDQLSPVLEPCDDFLRKNDVGYLMTTEPLTKQNASCATLIKSVHYPQMNIYFYSLFFGNQK